MKRYLFPPIFISCVLSLLLFTSSAVSEKTPPVIQDGVDSNFHLYLLIGQSNMAGRGKVDEQHNQADPRLYMLDKNDEWVLAKDPLHFDRPKAVGVGPGLSFAKAMIKGKKDIQIGLIPSALGGSPIRAWKSGGEFTDVFPYDEAIRRAKIAMKRGVLKGILWHQGESDSNVEASKVYLEKLVALIKQLREDLGDPDLPFVAGELGYYRPRYDLINEELKKLPEAIENTAVVSAKGLTHKGDTTHFNTESAQKFGKRYAKAMKKLIR